jgi:hypothetical protein
MKITVNKVVYDLDVSAAIKNGVAKKVTKKVEKKPVHDKYHYAGNYYLFNDIQFILVKSLAGFAFVCLEDGTVWDLPFKTKNPKFATNDEVKRNITGWHLFHNFECANANGPVFEIILPKSSREIDLDGRSYSLNEDASLKCGFLIPKTYEVGDVLDFDVTKLLLVEFSEDEYGFIDIFTGHVYTEFSKMENYPFTYDQLVRILGGSFKRVNVKFESGSGLNAYLKD